MEAVNGRATYVKPDDSKYKDGFFKHRQANDKCKHFGGRCPVNRKQKDPEYNVCESFCIPARKDKKTHSD